MNIKVEKKIEFKVKKDLIKRITFVNSKRRHRRNNQCNDDDNLWIIISDCLISVY